MNRGYVKIWRKSLDSGWIKNHKLWAFWSYCLLKATHKEYDAIIGLQVVHLLPGQFIFGLLAASNETGLTIRQIRTALTFLITAGNMTIKTTNKFSIISIVNWNTYQSQENENDTLNDKQVTNKAQHTRSKEVKKEKILSSCLPEIKTVIDYLNEKTGKRFKATSDKTGVLIQARLTDGFTMDDFKAVIDNQTVKWKTDSKMSQYLRPETLFGTKFEGYLNAAPIKDESPVDNQGRVKALGGLAY